MESVEFPLHLHLPTAPAPLADVGLLSRPTMGGRTAAPVVQRSLGEDADRLTALLLVLDDAVSGIRHALGGIDHG